MNQTNHPTKQALIQFAESLVITAIIAALVAIGPILLQSGPISWKQAAIAFSIAFVFSIAHGVATYLKAYNFPLATIIDADISAIERKVNPPQGGSVIATSTTVVTPSLQGQEEVSK